MARNELTSTITIEMVVASKGGNSVHGSDIKLQVREDARDDPQLDDVDLMDGY